MAIFISSDLLPFFYLSPLYILCMAMFLFPVSAAFYSSGIFMFILLPYLLPIPNLLKPCWAFILLKVPSPLPCLLCAHPLPAGLPAFRLPHLLPALLVQPLLLVYISRSLLMSLEGSVTTGPWYSSQQADMLTLSLVTIVGKQIISQVLRQTHVFKVVKCPHQPALTFA